MILLTRPVKLVQKTVENRKRKRLVVIPVKTVEDLFASSANAIEHGVADFGKELGVGHPHKLLFTEDAGINKALIEALGRAVDEPFERSLE